MARKRRPEPFWREARSCWFVQIGAKQIRLSSDRDEAYRLYHEMMARPASAEAASALSPAATPGSMLVDQVAEHFMDWLQVNRKPATYDIYKRLLAVFLASLPRTQVVADLRPFHLTRVMDANAGTWSRNTRHDFATTVQRMFNWAVKQGIIPANPIGAAEKPAREARELAVTPADHAKILAAVDSPAFRDLLILAWETGSRPQELRAIEARHFDRDAQRIVFPPSEAKGGRKHRVIYLGSAVARDLVAKLVAERPAGPILLNEKGRPWTKDSVNCGFQRLKKRAGLSFHLGAYRKGFVTRALKNGVDTVTTAHLVGHSDASMVSRIYGRVQQDPEFMAEAARRASAEKPVKGAGSDGK